MKFLLSLLLLTVSVQAMCIKPKVQQAIQETQTSLNWLQEFLGANIDQKACGDKCECPHKCACTLKNASPDLADYENVDDLDVWELDQEDPHNCCGCVCGCYNHAAAEKIKKLEHSRSIAKEVEVQEKHEAEVTAIEKKTRAEAHIDDADATAAMRIKKAEAARTAAEVKAEKEIAAARAAAAAERDDMEGVISLADETAAHDKWRAEKTEKDTEISIDEKIERAEKIAAQKKAEEKAAYEEKKRLEEIAIHSANLAGDDVKAAEAALHQAEVKAARATVEADVAAEDAQCMRSCVTEENCNTCHVSK